MDGVSVEIVGKILSHVRAARSVVIASLTCRTWRKAFKSYLHTLSFSIHDWRGYRDLTISQLEVIITVTILQTTGLECLSIQMVAVHAFSAASVISWLMYTRDTLRDLSFNIRTATNVNILERCGRLKLESLDLHHTSINGLEPSYQRFPRLKFLSLSHANVSPLDLSLLLASCPILETLALDSLEIAWSDAQPTMEICSSTLKKIYVRSLDVGKIIVEADHLEVLHLNAMNLDLFKLVGKGTLKFLKIDDVCVTHLDIGECTANLEAVDVSNFTILWPNFYQMISASNNLRRLRLWGAAFHEDDKIIDLEAIAICFPELRHLSLTFDLKDSVHFFDHLQEPTPLQNVFVLDLGWMAMCDHVGCWVTEMMKRCPNLRKLVIHGVLSNVKTREQRQLQRRMLADFSSTMAQLIRKYTHIDVQYNYD